MFLLPTIMLVSACGSPLDGGVQIPSDPDQPIVQVWSTGGFGPVELILGAGPRYTLLADGRLIHEGPVVAVYPGPLLPNYQMVQIDSEQMSSVLRLVEAIGLPDFEFDRDDSELDHVADAQTDVIHFWDDEGRHTYEVYALGLDPMPSSSSNKAFLELNDLLDRFTTENASSYQPEKVQVIVGTGFVDTEFGEVRDWPLDETDFSDWTVLPNQWMCKTFGPEVMTAFQTANQATLWLHPDPMMDAPPFKLLVRPLHPGEADCPE